VTYVDLPAKVSATAPMRIARRDSTRSHQSVDADGSLATNPIGASLYIR
jgi:hypothetical protein